ncbi:hypothetical protein CRUP_016717 [Coryphaenoides rupestris]|nr:hypothetical protein CRUP_016717 [Coryphaenoides rupestris]
MTGGHDVLEDLLFGTKLLWQTIATALVDLPADEVHQLHLLVEPEWRAQVHSGPHQSRLLKLFSEQPVFRKYITQQEVSDQFDVSHHHLVAQQEVLQQPTILESVGVNEKRRLGPSAAYKAARTAPSTDRRRRQQDRHASDRAVPTPVPYGLVPSEGRELVEAAAINKSLTALGQVRSGPDRSGTYNCGTGVRGSEVQLRCTFPFRNSKLTHLLQPCLSGDAKFGSSIQQVALGRAGRNVAPTKKNT